jgi:D-glycero-alpha-D-manno-heptose-7-phosphate kinase
MIYRAQVPLRIDFGGGWTDVPDFAASEADGGAVVNAAIDVYARGWIRRPYSPLVPVTLDHAETVDDTDDAIPADSALSKLTGRSHSARNEVHYELNAPAGAGLGGSAAQTLLWLTLVKTAIANVSSREELAERAWRIENELGITGGKQDQYACAVGGINFMTFGQETVVERLRLPLDFITQLEGRLSLFYTGQSHISGDVHDRVWSKYRASDEGVIAALNELRAVARAQREAIIASDLQTLGELMNRNWAAQKQLDPAVITERLDRYINVALNNGAIGAKATGAGGGGCFICLAEPGAGGVVEALKEEGATMIPFRFDWYGVHLTKG